MGGEPAYQALFAPVVQVKPYSAILQEVILPTIHPQDREKYGLFMGRTALLTDFLAGDQPPVEEYRVKSDQALGYEWHSAEFFCFWDPVSHKAMCNVFVRQVTEEKMRQLEEKRRLEEKEHTLFLQAKRLVESEEELDFVHVISDYYQGIYVVDLERTWPGASKVPRYFEEAASSRRGTARARPWTSTVRSSWTRDYVASFRAVTDYDNLRQSSRPSGRWSSSSISGTTLGAPAGVRHARLHPESQKTLWVFEDNTTTVNLRQEGRRRPGSPPRPPRPPARPRASSGQHEPRHPHPPQRHPGHVRTGPAGGERPGKGQLLPGHPGRRPGSCWRTSTASWTCPRSRRGRWRSPRRATGSSPPFTTSSPSSGCGPRRRSSPSGPRWTRPSPNTLYGDDINLTHIVMNLGSNAVKYTQTGTIITLTVAWEPDPGGEDGALYIRMEDTGIGIRQEDLPYIFQSYGRLDRKANRHIEGTGLGAHLPAAHPADARPAGVESTYGQGGTFWVRIPQKGGGPHPLRPLPGRGSGRKTTATTTPSPPPRRWCWWWTTSPLNLKVCQGLLGPYEMEVYTARSGQEALRQMTQVWPDLVLMDHMMPGMDGVEATARIREMGGRKDPYFAVVPIVALTANAMKGVREEFLQKGFNDFLPKPIELDKLDNVLRAWIPEDKQKAPAPAPGGPGGRAHPRGPPAPAGDRRGPGHVLLRHRAGLPQDPLPLPGADPPAACGGSGRPRRPSSGRTTSSRSTA